MIYYHSYNNVTSDQFSGAANMGSRHKRSLRSTKLNPSGNNQDCLGMTSLHIMAYSTVQSIDLYLVLIGKYPENLITEVNGEQYHYFMQFGVVHLMRLYGTW